MRSIKGRFTWQSSSHTHVGVVREINEDSYLIAKDIGLWAIADGMGGHEAGDIASKIVVDSLRSISFSSNRIALLRNLRQRLMGANEKILNDRILSIQVEDQMRFNSETSRLVRIVCTLALSNIKLLVL